MISYLQLSTLVLWSTCFVAGVVGVVIPYSRPREIAPEPPALQAEVLQVELSNEPMVQQNAPAPQANPLTAPPEMKLEAPAMTPMLAVAAPSEAIAFALPVTEPAIIVEKSQASFTKPVQAPEVVSAAPPVTQTLTFGQGEARQPAPDYPYKAMKDGQQGAVLVQFTVDEFGKVLTAEASKPSPWSLLNQAAVKVIKDRWRFQPGKLRRYEVMIRFQLN